MMSLLVIGKSCPSSPDSASFMEAMSLRRSPKNSFHSPNISSVEVSSTPGPGTYPWASLHCCLSGPSPKTNLPCDTLQEEKAHDNTVPGIFGKHKPCQCKNVAFQRGIHYILMLMFFALGDEERVHDNIAPGV